MKEQTGLRIGIIGCGTIAQVHADAVLRTTGVELACLVDTDEARARRFASLFQLTCPILTDYRDAMDGLDGAIVALPHHLHGHVTLTLLEAGIHVLCEKPLATSIEEAESCVARGAEKNLTLAVGMIRRFHWSTELMRFLLCNGVLGSLLRFEYVDGQAHAWPSATPFYFKRELAGGGIFTTMGVHMIDSLLAWFDDLEVVDYADDNFGGVEAEAWIHLGGRIQGATVPGFLRCTNLYTLRSHFTVVGSDASASVHGDNTVSVELQRSFNGRQLASWMRDPRAPETAPPDSAYFAAQIRDFADAIRTGTPPKADGRTAVRTMKIIDRCYAVASRIDQSWMHPIPFAMETLA